MGEKSIRVLLADDHPFVRAGIRGTLQVESDISLVGEACNGEEARQMCKDLMPDVLLLDLDMPKHRPVDTVNYVQEECQGTKIVVLTAFDDDAYVKGLIGLGVQGYVLKDEAPESVVQAIRVLAQGGAWYSPKVMSKLIRVAPAPNLSEREQRLLHLLTLGLDNRSIASRLGLSEQTVRNNMTELYQKLNLRSRSEAILWAINHNLDRVPIGANTND